MTSWLAEDPELLRAALEIIDTWDEQSAGDSISVRSPLTDGSESTGDDTDGAVEDKDVARKPPNGNHASTDGSLMVTMRLPPLDVKPLKTEGSTDTVLATRELKPSTVASTRHKRREEIIYLRDKVKEMETQLALLEKAKNDSERASSTEASADKALTIMWHDIATRQQRLRQKSELDQAKLRKLLQTQMKVAEGLMKLMQKARRIEEDEAFPRTKRARLTGGPGLRLNGGAQLARLYSHYENLDAAFTFFKFHDGSLKFVDIEVTDEADEEVIIEYREAWTVPFEMGCVLDALWHYTLKKSEEKWCKPDYDSNTTVTMDGTELVSRFTARSSIGGFIGSFHGQATVKRFAGGGGKTPAIVTVMNTEPAPVEPGDIDGFYMHDDTFIRVLPVNSVAHETGGKHVTVVQCMQRFEMRFDERAEKARQGSGALTNMILDKLKDDIELKHSTVETLLLCSRSR